MSTTSAIGRPKSRAVLVRLWDELFCKYVEMVGQFDVAVSDKAIRDEWHRPPMSFVVRIDDAGHAP